MATRFSPLVPEPALTSAAMAFAENGHVRIETVFSPGAAASLYRHLSGELAWSRVFNQGEKTWDLGPESITALAGADAPLLEAVHRSARDGFQFLFDSFRVSDHPGERAGRALLVDQLIDALNGQAWINVLRRVTGFASIAMVDGQATRYLPGHFLTGHDDDVTGKNRLAAYVINLTPNWRTEWGGLLQFHDAADDVRFAYRPCFNAIHLFRVPQLHSVSYVAPFAPEPRFSITGWLRGAPA